MKKFLFLAAFLWVGYAASAQSQLGQPVKKDTAQISFFKRFLTSVKKFEWPKITWPKLNSFQSSGDQFNEQNVALMEYSGAFVVPSHTSLRPIFFGKFIFSGNGIGFHL